MVVVGKYRNRTELRKKPRRHFRYTAKIITGTNPPQIACSISDISEIGARLELESDSELPGKFLLLLTRDGHAQRQCRLIWRAGMTIGVDFPQRR